MKVKLTEINLGAYITPEIKPLEIDSEGVLCGSFGDANMAGKMLKESDEFVWNF